MRARRSDGRLFAFVGFGLVVLACSQLAGVEDPARDELDGGPGTGDAAVADGGAVVDGEAVADRVDPVQVVDGSPVDAGPLAENLIPSSDLAMNFLNDSQGVTVVTETVPLPTGGTGDARKCDHTKRVTGGSYFRHGAKLTLTAGTTYTLSFFFRNETVSSPWGTAPLLLGAISTTFSPSFSEFKAPLSNAVPFANGWFRQTLTFTPGTSGIYDVGFNQDLDQPLLGTYRLFGFQLEKGPAATQYHRTN